MTTTTATIDYTYGDTVTTVPLPLPIKQKYTKGQQALVGTAVANGWTLDTTAILNTYGGYGNFARYTAEQRASYLVQHPFTFVKPAADGGTWTVELDYADRDYSYYGSRGFNATLKGARLSYTAADGKVRFFDHAVSGYANSRGELVLEKQSVAGWASVNYVTQVTPGDTLRDKVASLLENPDVVAWLAVEAQFKATQAERAARAEEERIRELKSRPLPAGWNALQVVAAQVAKADGMSDTEALLSALKAAVAAVEEDVVVR